MAGRLLRRSGISVGLVAERIGYRPTAIVQVGIGLNHAETEVFVEEWPGVQLIGIEAHPKIARAVKAGYPGKVHHAAVGNPREPGEEVVLYAKHPHKDGSSLRPFDDDVGGDVEKVLVPLVALSQLQWDEYPRKGILLWLDCEGSELDALRGAGEFLDRVDVINIEMTPRPFGAWDDTVDIDDWLIGRGFLCQWVHTQRGTQYDAIYVRESLFRPEFCCCPESIRKHRNSK